MHYTKIEMAESMSTRGGGGSHESRYILRISSKAGLSKDLYSNVSKTCGIKFQCYVGVALLS